ncbi:hypothetical protein [Paucisalibacillus globulus]|uniref:hypothetical protein n=1 Tax=Paucisalibacillus globulus TaxID=351095 RepID=UPI000400E9DE|nr:hypothetical protein [Paucisalibacillus globulus]
MNNWKIAYQINKWELKKSIFNIMLSYLVMLVFSLYLAREFPLYLESGLVFFDLVFLFMFGAAPLLPKPKAFEVQQIQSKLFVSPMVVLQKHLAIKNNVIIRSRLIMHTLYTFPMQLVALLILYSTTSLHNILSIGSFISFGLIWLSFSIYVGYMVPSLNIGVRMFWGNNTIFSVIFLLLIIILLFGLTLVHVVFDHGIVYWSILFARDYPLATGGISILLAFLGYHFWRNSMRKSLGRLMYG